jgi:hypothetical protein
MRTSSYLLITNEPSNPLKSPGGLGHKQGADVQKPQNWDGWLAISKFLRMMRLDQPVLILNSSKYLAKLKSNFSRTQPRACGGDAQGEEETVSCVGSMVRERQTISGPLFLRQEVIRDWRTNMPSTLNYLDTLYRLCKEPSLAYKRRSAWSYSCTIPEWWGIVMTAFLWAFQIGHGLTDIGQKVVAVRKKWKCLTDGTLTR